MEKIEGEKIASITPFIRAAFGSRRFFFPLFPFSANCRLLEKQIARRHRITMCSSILLCPPYGHYPTTRQRSTTRGPTSCYTPRRYKTPRYTATKRETATAARSAHTVHEPRRHIVFQFFIFFILRPCNVPRYCYYYFLKKKSFFVRKKTR